MYEIKYGTKTIVILYNGKVIAASRNIFELLLKLRKWANSEESKVHLIGWPTK